MYCQKSRQWHARGVHSCHVCHSCHCLGDGSALINVLLCLMANVVRHNVRSMESHMAKARPSSIHFGAKISYTFTRMTTMGPRIIPVRHRLKQGSPESLRFSTVKANIPKNQLKVFFAKPRRSPPTLSAISCRATPPALPLV